MNGPLGIFARVLINAIFLLVLSATAVEGRSLLGDNEAATVYQARDLLARANQCIVDKDYRRADYLLTGLFSSPGFQQFEVHERLEAYRAKVQALIELGLVLFIVTFIINALARLLVWSMTRRQGGAHA